VALELKVTAFSTITGKSFECVVRESVVCIGKSLSGEGYAVGADGGRLSLPSRMLAKEHAFFRFIAGGWMLQSSGLGNVSINNVSVSETTLHPVSFGDEVTLGEYCLTLAKVEDEAEETDNQSPAQLFVELERNMHAELLEKMDLRKSGSLVDLDERKTREKVGAALEAILVKGFKNLPKPVINYGAEEAVYRRLTRLATIAGSDLDEADIQAPGEDSSLINRTLNELSNKLAKNLELELSRDSMEADCKKIDVGFHTAFENSRLDLTQGFYESVAKSLLREKIYNLVFGLGPIQDLVDMESISEIMVVSKDKIYIEKFGVVEDSKRSFISDEALLTVIERIVAPAGRRVDRSSPMVDARLPDGSRVNAVIAPLAVKGPCLTIRKFSKSPISMGRLIEFGALDARLAEFMQATVAGKQNVVVSGGTGSGKTTILNALSSFISPKERIVTIEDTAELQLQQEHVITLEARPPNMEGKGEVSIQDLVKNSLRMRPDRIIVGECRGAEALDMLQAMNTGHDGSMTTGHANAPREMISRLETMVLMGTDMPVSAIREQIVAAVSVIIQLNREPSGRRLVTYVSEVVGVDPDSGEVMIEDIFIAKGDTSTSSALHTGYIPTFVPELIEKNIMSMDIFYGG
jgi:pilus assembly protein CpaF